jgi:hypothetical protein
LKNIQEVLAEKRYEEGIEVGKKRGLNIAYEELSKRNRMEIGTQNLVVANVEGPTGRRIMDLELLAKGTAKLACGNCGGKQN